MSRTKTLVPTFTNLFELNIINPKVVTNEPGSWNRRNIMTRMSNYCPHCKWKRMLDFQHSGRQKAKFTAVHLHQGYVPVLKRQSYRRNWKYLNKTRGSLFKTSRMLLSAHALKEVMHAHLISYNKYHQKSANRFLADDDVNSFTDALPCDIGTAFCNPELSCGWDQEMGSLLPVLLCVIFITSGLLQKFVP